MTGILDRLTAAIEEADAGTDALCAEYLAEAMASVRDLLDGSNGGYVAPQNRADMPRLVLGPIAAPASRGGTIQLNISPEFVAICREINRTLERGMQQFAASLTRTRR